MYIAYIYRKCDQFLPNCPNKKLGDFGTGIFEQHKFSVPASCLVNQPAEQILLVAKLINRSWYRFISIFISMISTWRFRPCWTLRKYTALSVETREWSSGSNHGRSRGRGVTAVIRNWIDARKYPLVSEQLAIENGRWNSGFTINSMVISHSYVNVYQRVVHIFTHTDKSLQRITSWCQARSDWSVGTVGTRQAFPGFSEPCGRRLKQLGKIAKRNGTSINMRSM